MRFDLHLRAGIKQRIDAIAHEMREWESVPRIDEAESAGIRAAIHSFDHTTTCDNLCLSGVDATGDFPALAYGDSFVFVTLAQATCYEASPVSGLREVNPTPAPVIEFTWVPEDETRRITSFDEAFSALAGAKMREVIELSDYRILKQRESSRANTIASLQEGLIRPHAADAGNIAVQLCSTGELGAALRLLRGEIVPTYMIMDGTLSLPFVGRGKNSLFFEHLKRLCCVEARTRGIGFFALSKSHGLPAIELFEEITREKFGLERGKVAEHWYLRVPVRETDGSALSLTQGRRLPPAGAMTYLIRFHRTTSVLRLDMDREFWLTRVQGATEEETCANERRIFEDLDYTSHDQRCYGYPYPMKAAHDRASLTRAERVALRKQIIDAALRAGMRRSLFRDAAQATRHE